MMYFTPFLLLLLLLLMPGLLHAQGSSIRFTPNRGQIIDMQGNVRPDILYTTEAPGMRIYFRETGISYVFVNVEENISGDGNHSPLTSISHDERSEGEISLYRVDVEFEGASSQPRVTTQETVGDYTNYYLAHCPDGITHVPAWRVITYHDIYPNIDLVFRSTERGMKYDFLVHPGGRVADIRLRYRGADELSKTEDGAVRVGTPLGDLTEGRPKTFQGDGATLVPSSFRLDGDLLRFDVGAYDSTRTLRIDPELIWSTYLGGTNPEFNISDYANVWAAAIASDAQKNLLTTGSTASPDFPVTTGAFQTTYMGDSDAFLIKLTSSGARIWSTFYGGIRGDHGAGVAVDSSSNIFISGGTGSTDFPVSSSAHQASRDGAEDSYLVKFDSAGIRLWGTYYGGNGLEWSNGIATDTAGNVIIATTTSSTGLATSGAYRMTRGAGWDVVVTKFDGAGNRLWATYSGGITNTLEPAKPRTTGVCTDRAGNIYVTSETAVAMFPTTPDAFQRTLADTASDDAFVIKFSPSGDCLWSTLLGGSDSEIGASITLDRENNVYVSGLTRSTDFPVTAGAYQTSNGGGAFDGFVASFTSSGTQRWATYYGGTGWDAFGGLAADRHGNITVTGHNFGSDDFPVTGDAYQSTRRGTMDAVIVRFDSTGQRLWGTYLGGSEHEWGAGLVVDGSGVIIAGTTWSTDFPTVNAFQSSTGGSGDIFISRFCLLTPRIFSPDLDICQGGETQLTAPDGYQYLWSTGATTQSISVNTDGRYWLRVGDGTCVGYDTITVSARPLLSPTPSVTPVGPITICEGDSATLDAGEWQSFLWSTGERTRTIIVKSAGNYSVTVEDANGCRGTSAPVVVTPAPPPAVPTISRRDDTLLASLAHSYQWIENGTDIAGATNRELVVLQPGSYSVRITDVNGCSATSAPFTTGRGEVASATVVVRNHQAAPGERITIPVDLERPRFLAINGLYSFRLQLRFNRSMLMPADATLPGTLDQSQRTITVTGTIDPTEGEQLQRLAEIEFLATLGDAIETPLQILSLEFDEGAIQLDTIHGSFTLTGLCENGGTRLVSSSGELTLKPSRPNPTSGLTTIEYEIIEHGPTRIYLTDMSGQKISLVDTNLDVGRYLASFDASSIPSGVYICILETRTARLTQVLVVLR